MGQIMIISKVLTNSCVIVKSNTEVSILLLRSKIKCMTFTVNFICLR